MASPIFDAGFLCGVSPQTGQLLRFGTLQEVTVDLQATLVRNPGNMFLGSVPTISNVALKFQAKTAQISGVAIHQLYFNSTPTAGSQGVSRDQTGTVPASGPYTVTPAVPNSGTWAQDLGVQYSGSGLFLLPVASFPAQGQYTVAAGVYTFNSADHGAALVFNYLYTQATGNSINQTNPWKGLAVQWQAILMGQYSGQQVVWNLARCATENFKMLLPLNDFTIPNFAFQAFGDASSVQGSVGTFSYPN